MSLDGYVAGPDQSLDAPLGVGGHGAARLGVRRPARAQTMLGGEAARRPRRRVHPPRRRGDRRHDHGPQHVRSGPRASGATSSWTGWWGDEPPYHHDVFVLTHHARATAGDGRRHDVPLRHRRDRVGARRRRRPPRTAPTSAWAAAPRPCSSTCAAGLVDELHVAVVPDPARRRRATLRPPRRSARSATRSSRCHRRLRRPRPPRPRATAILRCPCRAPCRSSSWTTGSAAGRAAALRRRLAVLAGGHRRRGGSAGAVRRHCRGAAPAVDRAPAPSRGHRDLPRPDVDEAPGARDVTPAASLAWRPSTSRYARRTPGPAAPRRRVAWARHRARRTGSVAVQQRTWNLSAIWRLTTSGGTAWLKQVPGVLRPRARRCWPGPATAVPGVVPDLLAAGEDGRMLLEHVDGRGPLRRPGRGAGRIAATEHRLQRALASMLSTTC